MSITLTENTVGNAVIVMRPSGRLTLGEGSSQFRGRIEELVYGRALSIQERWYGFRKPPGKPANILVDPSEISYVDSSGVGELFSAHTTITGNGGQIKLLKLTKRIRDLLQITKLYMLFEIFEDEACAVRSFN